MVTEETRESSARLQPNSSSSGLKKMPTEVAETRKAINQDAATRYQP